MSKASGGTRIVKPISVSKAENAAVFNMLMRSGLYDIDKSFITESGAYVAYMIGHNYHDEEMEAARAVSQNGLNVIFTPEGDGFEIFATNEKGGNYKYSEGTISMITFEQKTPEHIEKTAETTIKSAIVHANTKKAKIALIYDKYNLFHEKDIENGMKLYQSKDKAWKKKVMAVLVVNSKGKLYEHQFD